jgi:rhodanese-related sulfurtransferase
MDCINNHSLELDTNNQPQCLTMLEAIKLIGTHGLKILDMRKNTLNHSDFERIHFDLAMITKLDYIKEQPLAVLCSYGYKSKLAAMKLVAIGYKNVYYIEQS